MIKSRGWSFAFTSGFLILFLVGAAAVCTWVLQSHRRNESTKNSCELLAESIRTMPAWIRCRSVNDPQCREIEARLYQIAGHDVSEIHCAFKLCLDRPQDDEEYDRLEGNLLLINRYVFDFGPGDHSEGVFDPWHHEQGPGVDDWTWPLKVDDRGYPTIIDTHHGYTGPRYKPLWVFEYCQNHFPQRKITR